MAQDERRAVQLRDDVGHGEGLSRACHPQQGVMFGAVPDRADELCDRFRLVAHRGVIRYQLEIHGAKVGKKNGMVKYRPGLAGDGASVSETYRGQLKLSRHAISSVIR